MEIISIDTLPENSLFHFTENINIDSIQEEGILPQIGENAKGIEETKKIFFSKGEIGVLKANEVWLRWLMNRIFGPKDRLKMYINESSEETKKRLSEWTKEFLTRKYFDNESKKEKLFEYFYSYTKERTYLVLDIHDGEEYFEDDIDENKEKVKKSKEYILIKFAEEMYGSFSDFESLKMDNWNMHTRTGTSISPDKIKQVITPEGKTDMLDIVLYLHEKYKDIDHSRFLLDDFVKYAKKRLEIEEMTSKGEFIYDQNNNSR